MFCSVQRLQSPHTGQAQKKVAQDLLFSWRYQTLCCVCLRGWGRGGGYCKRPAGRLLPSLSLLQLCHLTVQCAALRIQSGICSLLLNLLCHK